MSFRAKFWKLGRKIAKVRLNLRTLTWTGQKDIFEKDRFTDPRGFTSKPFHISFSVSP